MTEVASAYVSLMPSARGFGSSMQRQINPQITSAAKTSGSRFGKVFAYSSMSPLKAIGAAAVGLFAVAKVKDFFAGAIDEARESQKVSALTAAVIKSTGGAAGLSAEQVGNLANKLSLLTGMDDEAIQGAENLLLTFTNLRNEAGRGNDIFTQATKIVTDMSVALDQDLKSSSIQVGKALNDPIKGVTALQRVGVSFTEAQKEQIKTLVDSGHTLTAQKLILRELNKEFGGAAGAAATAGDRFKTAFANLQETVGLALLPYLDRLLVKGTAAINFLMTQVPPAFAAFKSAIAPVVAAIQDLVENHLTAFKTALAALGGAGVASVVALIGGALVSALGVLVGALTSPIALIGALVGAVIYAYTHFESFRVAVNNLGAYLNANLVPVLVQLGGVIRDQVLPIIVSFGKWIFGTFYPTMIKFWLVVGQKLQPALSQLGRSLATNVLPPLRQLLVQFHEAQPTLQRVATFVLKVQVAYNKFGATILGQVLPPLIRFTAFLVGAQLRAYARTGAAIGTAIGWMTKLGHAFAQAGRAVANFASTVKAKMGQAVGFVKSVPSRIGAVLSQLRAIGEHAGAELISGLVAGMLSRLASAVAAAQRIASSIKDHFPGSPVKKGPLKSWNRGQTGKKLIQMLADGIIAGSPKAIAAATHAATGIQKAVLDRLNSIRDGAKSTLDGLKSDFASLRGSIAQAFTGDLFSATDVGAFNGNLSVTKATLTRLKAALTKLTGWGVNPGFLSQLFASGNTNLILQLAGGSKANALNDARLFGQVNSLSQQLGTAVARDQYGAKLDRQTAVLERIDRGISRLPKDFGHEVNKGAKSGHRKGGKR